MRTSRGQAGGGVPTTAVDGTQMIESVISPVHTRLCVHGSPDLGLVTGLAPGGRARMGMIEIAISNFKPSSMNVSAREP